MRLKHKLFCQISFRINVLVYVHVPVVDFSVVVDTVVDRRFVVDTVGAVLVLVVVVFVVGLVLGGGVVIVAGGEVTTDNVVVVVDLTVAGEECEADCCTEVVVFISAVGPAVLIVVGVLFDEEVEVRVDGVLDVVDVDVDLRVDVDLSVGCTEEDGACPVVVLLGVENCVDLLVKVEDGAFFADVVAATREVLPGELVAAVFVGVGGGVVVVLVDGGSGVVVVVVVGVVSSEQL